MRSDIISQLCDIAVRTKRKITWDPKKETIVGDDEAAKMMHRDDAGPVDAVKPGMSPRGISMYVLLYRTRLKMAHPRLARSQRRRRFQRHSVAVGSGLNETTTTAGSISWLARPILLFALAIDRADRCGRGG